MSQGEETSVVIVGAVPSDQPFIEAVPSESNPEAVLTNDKIFKLLDSRRPGPRTLEDLGKLADDTEKGLHTVDELKKFEFQSRRSLAANMPEGWDANFGSMLSESAKVLIVLNDAKLKEKGRATLENAADFNFTEGATCCEDFANVCYAISNLMECV